MSIVTAKNTSWSRRFCIAILWMCVVLAFFTGIFDIAFGLASQEVFGGDLNANGKNDPSTDNLFRFFGALWFGYAPLIWICMRDLPRYFRILQIMACSITLGGFGRVCSVLQIGLTDSSVGRTVILTFMIFEILVFPYIAFWLEQEYGGETDNKKAK